jgi:hypothetical protein
VKPEFDPAHAEKMQAGLDLFKSRVREVLIKQCVDCHGGPEVESQLDLATRKGLVRGGAHGSAVKPGKAKESRLYILIAHQEKPYMPEGGEKLSADTIDAIGRWIDLGAPYDKPLVDNPRDPDAWVDRRIDPAAREHWAFQPIKKTTPPVVKNPSWTKTPPDRFILAALEAKGMTPNDVAKKHILIRRAYFDLIGLPPSAEEVEKFVSDADPEAYSKMIDRLLDSPHYGERWGRHWLDAARFAESHGFEQDYDRPYAYHFRDFVIQALNEDLPFDRFVKWQLAGDEFEPENPLALKATGFLGAGVFPTQITANEVERTRYDALDDMAATVGTAMLGLTVGCARCHDHKFDPIPQGDYYRFISTFTTTVRSNLDVNVEPEKYQAAKAAFDAAHAPLVAARAQFERDQLPGRFAEWEKSEAAAAARQATWWLLDAKEAKSKGGATLTKQADGSLLASGTNPDNDTYTITAELAPGTYTGIRLEALAHPSLVKGGPGRAANGNFALSDFSVSVKPTSGGEERKLKLQNPQTTFEQPNLFVRYAIDEDKKSAWAVDPQFGKDHRAVFEFAEDLQLAAPATITFTLDFQNNAKHSLGRPRVAITKAARPLPLSTGGLSPQVAQALNRPADQRSAEQTQAALTWYRTQDAEWQKLEKVVQDHLAQEPKPNLVKMMICSEGVPAIRHHTQGGDFLNETHYLKRGDCDQKQGVAPQGFLQVLMTNPEREKRWQVQPPAGSKTSYRRRSLADWITDTEAGAGQLLARVAVNRLWQHHFGRGIVSTPNDFGTQGSPPSHPELLDWLASEFIAGGWRMKPLHKLLMTSSAYMQSSAPDAADEKADPENRLLWRFTPRRLEAEVIRDSMLAVSGELDRTQFGPGSLDEAHKRRSIYFMIKRSKLIPMMQIFDQPEPLVSVGNRPSTTIAPQALLFMNSPQVRGYAHSLGKRLREAFNQQPESAVRLGYVSVVGRPPDADELAASLTFLQSQQASYKNDGKANAAELALADFAQVLFELNEFIYIE